MDRNPQRLLPSMRGWTYRKGQTVIPIDTLQEVRVDAKNDAKDYREFAVRRAWPNYEMHVKRSDSADKIKRIAVEFAQALDWKSSEQPTLVDIDGPDFVVVNTHVPTRVREVGIRVHPCLTDEAAVSALMSGIAPCATDLYIDTSALTKSSEIKLGGLWPLTNLTVVSKGSESHTLHTPPCKRTINLFGTITPSEKTQEAFGHCEVVLLDFDLSKIPESTRFMLLDYAATDRSCTGAEQIRVRDGLVTGKIDGITLSEANVPVCWAGPLPAVIERHNGLALAAPKVIDFSRSTQASRAFLFSGTYASLLYDRIATIGLNVNAGAVTEAFLVRYMQFMCLVGGCLKDSAVISLESIHLKGVAPSWPNGPATMTVMELVGVCASAKHPRGVHGIRCTSHTGAREGVRLLGQFFSSDAKTREAKILSDPEWTGMYLMCAATSCPNPREQQSMIAAMSIIGHSREADVMAAKTLFARFDPSSFVKVHACAGLKLTLVVQHVKLKSFSMIDLVFE
jgi:hypothetical protein